MRNLKNFKRSSRHVFMLALVGLLNHFPYASLAATNNVIGVYTNWPTAWIQLNGLNDPNDGLAKTQIDFVGDATDPSTFYASTNGYVFFRQRVQINSTNQATFGNAHFVAINMIGTNYGNGNASYNNHPDYAFGWDNFNNTDILKHGLEMQVLNRNGSTTWKTTKLDDIDGDPNEKTTLDINGAGRTTDGYVRVMNEQNTLNFGYTTFIDYAVSWDYLQKNTGLNSNQTWKVACGSIINGNDHQAIDGDVGGNATPDSLIADGWASLVTTPTGSAIPPQGTYYSFE